MKKKLEAELISIAHRILKLKDKSTLSQLQEESRQLYEKLTILNFSETHFAGPQPTIGQIKAVLDPPVSDEMKDVQEKINAIMDPKPEPVVEIPEPELPLHQNPEEDTTSEEGKPEIIIEEINARVTEDLFIPANSVENTDSLLDTPLGQSTYQKNDKDEVTPTVQDIVTQKNDDDRPKSLNDQLRKEIHIGLNDRLAFIKHLFEGSTADYNRVLSQLNTLRTKNEAKEFIITMIKPDYHNWDGKEEYEERFMDIVLSKFEE